MIAEALWFVWVLSWALVNVFWFGVRRDHGLNLVVGALGLVHAGFHLRRVVDGFFQWLRAR